VQSALWCQECGDGIFDADDAKIGQMELAEMKAEAEGVPSPCEVARIQTKTPTPSGPADSLQMRPIGLLKGQIRMTADFDETPADLIAAMTGDEG
jgi:hypothetical protein